MKNAILLLITTLCATIAAAPVSARVRVDDTAGAQTQSAYQKSGVINSIDLGSRAIVIDGVSYLFPSGNVKLHNKTATVTTAQQLKKNMRIGFNSKPGSAGSRAQITDVWVLE
ncbi:MAG: hypothetical protein HZA59_13280 [Hydrogenophilales bacterium]|nr:hypothetical protein [Hydrogenophilales bacterium]